MDTELNNISPENAISTDLLASTEPPLFFVSNGTDDSFSLDSTHKKVAQNFSVSHNKIATAATLSVADLTGLSLVGNLYAAIYSDDAGSPDTAIGTSDAIDATTVVYPQGSIYFTFSTPVALSPGAQYYIVFYGDSTYIAGSDHLTTRSKAAVAGTYYQDVSDVWTPTADISLICSVRSSIPSNIGASDQPFDTVFSNKVQLTSADSEPSPDASMRGMIRINQGGTLVADVMKVCIKDATDAYVWKTVTLV